MRDHAASLRALFATVLAGVAAAPLGCRHDAPTTVTADTTTAPLAADAAAATDTAPEAGARLPRLPFHCPPPYEVVLDGGLPPTAVHADSGAPGMLPADVCRELCGPGGPRCSVVKAGPPTTVECGRICIGGRRPEGYCDVAGSAGDEVACWLASLGSLEAASVPAFRRVARELGRLGAPRRLESACRRAARDEIRHARGARGLARARGARAGGFAAAPERTRSLEELAIENAVEGCVRETYGALVATWQAARAGDARLRAHFARIARDETEHAALAWRIDAWAQARLDRAARGRVEAARRAARDELVASLASSPPADLIDAAGLPAATDAVRLAAALDEALDSART